MRKFLKWANYRNLLFGVTAMGVLASQSAPGTLAFFTSTAVSANNTFTAGVINLTTGGTSLPSGTFSWNTAFGGANCANTLTGTDITGQRMDPGHFCTAPVDIGNVNTGAVDSWLRVRLVRQTDSDSSVNDELNHRLRFYLAEYDSQANRNTDCTAANFRTALGGSTSAGVIANTATRTSRGSLNQDGAALGNFPTAATDNNLLTAGQLATSDRADNSLGILDGFLAAPTDTTIESVITTAGATKNGANIIGNDEVTNPVKTTGAAATTLSGATTAPNNTLVVASATGFAIGEQLVIDTGTNTEVRTITNVAGTTITVGADLLVNHADTVAVTSTPYNGTNAAGLNTEAELAAGGTKYYCAAMFFPSNSGVAAGVGTANNAGDNKAQGGSNIYSFVVTAAQKAGRTSTD